MPKLCLGTAQFGLAYGVTNNLGKVSIHEAREIVEDAAMAGFGWVDTAQGYGDSESVLGEVGAARHGLQIIDKIDIGKQRTFISEDVEAWEISLQKSLKALRCNKLDTLLLHRSDCLKWERADLLKEWLADVRNRGTARRIGVSIYDTDELIGLDREFLDVIQLPASIYDQRALRHPLVLELSESGTAIHCRSVLLQGLVISPIEAWPSWVCDQSQQRHRQLEEYASSREQSLIEVALGFIKSQSIVEAAVIGVCNATQLKEVIDTWSCARCEVSNYWDRWASNDIALIDPRRWKA